MWRGPRAQGLPSAAATPTLQAGPIDDLNQPSFRLHQLKGDFKGCWATTVRANWRIVFRFKGDKASNVDPVDYQR